jgi:hypothetical protein
VNEIEGRGRPGDAEPHIGTLNEGSLHAELKTLLAEPGDELEVPVDRFVVDIRRHDLLIEIQTGSFAAMARKLDVVLDTHRVLVVHPVAVNTYLIRPERRPRRSPKKGSILSVLDELVSVPTLIDHPNFAVRVALVDVEALQRADPGARRGRGGWRTVDRRLRTLHRWHDLRSVDDLVALLPPDLPEVFTTADVADTTRRTPGLDLHPALPRTGPSRNQARKLLYCLRALDVVEVIDRRRDGYRYRLRARHGSNGPSPPTPPG